MLSGIKPAPKGWGGYNNNMPTNAASPLPPLELRHLVSPLVDDSYYDNPTGDYIWGALDIPPLQPGEGYRKVFDFGCGCGREARQLFLQRHPPEKYVGIDVHLPMIEWCRQNLASDRAEFIHHDVWNSTYARNNTPNRVLPISHLGTDFSIIEVNSVFTHIHADQAQFYLEEMRKMLSPRGIIRSSWLLFNKQSFPVMTANENTLFVDEAYPTAAVYYDWNFVVAMVRNLGFRIIQVEWSKVLGHQNRIYLGGNPDFVDHSDVVPPGTSVVGF